MYELNFKRRIAINIKHIISIIILLIPNYLFAGSCNFKYFEESVTGAKKVFIGILESKVESVNSYGRIATTAVFKVTHPIKGKVEEIEIITISSALCGVYLPVYGVEYPIFANEKNELDPSWRKWKH